MSECHELATALSDADTKALGLQDAISAAEMRCESAEQALAASQEQKASLELRYGETIQALAGAEEALRAEVGAKRELEERYNGTINDFQEQLLVCVVCTSVWWLVCVEVRVSFASLGYFALLNPRGSIAV